MERMGKEKRRRGGDKKRLWQTPIWPRLLSESSLACQISVLTVNSHICAEHRGVSCTMASWFRIRLDKAIGWLTHRQTHFHFPSDSLLVSCHCHLLTARVPSQIVYFHEYLLLQCRTLAVGCTNLDMGFCLAVQKLQVFFLVDVARS